MSEVGVAAVTVPAAPSLKTTVLLLAVVPSNPEPLMVSVVALAGQTYGWDETNPLSGVGARGMVNSR